MTSKYDIFISYKRKSLPTANNLYYRLTTRGFSTFFDLEELGRDNFNVQLLNYIENAKDVFVILEEGSLDACKRKDWEKDWFCREIAFALEKKKNIIPVVLDGYSMPPEDFFPDRLKEFHFKQSPEFSFSFFNEYLDKLIERGFLLSKPNKQDKIVSVFKFYSNENCQVYKEGKLVCSLEGMSDVPYYLPVLRKGDYRFKSVNVVSSETKMIKEHIDAEEEKEVEIEWEEHVPFKSNPVSEKEPPRLPDSSTLKLQSTTQTPLQALEERLARLDKEIGDLFFFKNASGKYGYKDVTGNVVIPCKWDVASDFSEGLAAVQDSSGKWGFIVKTGILIIPCKWDFAGEFGEGIAQVKNSSDMWGFIDKTGKLITPCKWDYTEQFSEGLAAVKDSSGKWSFIDKTGNLITPCKWDSVLSFHKGLARVEDSNGKWGFINKTGSLIIPCKWDDAGWFSEGLSNVKDSSGKWGFIDKTGNLIIPCKWNDAFGFSGGLAEVKDSSGKRGFIDKTGNLIIPCKWDFVFGFSEGLARVQDSSGKWGFIDKTGSLIIPCKWDYVEGFSEGLARVMDSSGEWHDIDKTGKVIS